MTQVYNCKVNVKVFGIMMYEQLVYVAFIFKVLKLFYLQVARYYLTFRLP